MTVPPEAVGRIKPHHKTTDALVIVFALCMGVTVAGLRAIASRDLHTATASARQATRSTDPPGTHRATPPLSVVSSRELAGVIDDLAWAGPCLLALRNGELYRYELGSKVAVVDPVPVLPHRSWVQLTSGPAFGIAVEGLRDFPPTRPRPPIVNVAPEVLNAVTCRSNNSLEMWSSFGNTSEFVIGGPVENSRVYSVGAADQWNYYSGDDGCCENPHLVVDSLRTPTNPVRRAEVLLTWARDPWYDNRDWKPAFDFAAAGPLVAVSGINDDLDGTLQMVILSIDDDGTIDSDTRVQGFGGHIAFHEGDLYAGHSTEIRRYHPQPDGGIVYDSFAAPAGVGDVVKWGDSLVTIVMLAEPSPSGHIGAIFEVDATDLTFKYVADFPWRDYIRAEAWGQYLVLYAPGSGGAMIMERALEYAVYIPRTG